MLEQSVSKIEVRGGEIDSGKLIIQSRQKLVRFLADLISRAIPMVSSVNGMGLI